MTKNLKQKAVSGAKWNGVFHFGKYFITFFLSIVLARLLDPSEFGLLGMLTIITVVAKVFIDSGLSVAIIRIKNIEKSDYSTMFFFNVLVSTLFYVLLYFTAPFVAQFYNEPQLSNLTRWISLVFLINSLGLVQNAILVRELNFKKQSVCNLTGILASAIISTIMAFAGFGVYSIVGQALSQALVTNILFWVTSNWRPSFIFSKKSFLKLWSFGSKVLGVNIITQIVDNIDNLVIGKIFSAAQLGFYVRAKSTKQMPEQIFSNILNATVFPVLTKVSDEKDEFNRLHLKFYRLAVFLYLPIAFGFAAVAKSFTIVLFSEKWLPSVPILQIIIFISISYFIGALFMQTIMAKGEGKLYFRINSAKKILTLLAIPFAIWGGVYPFVISLTLISFFNLGLDYYFTARLLRIPLNEYIKPVSKILLITFLMGVSTFVVQFIPIKYNLVILLLQISTGVLSYTILSIVFRVNQYYDVMEVLKEQLKTFLSRFRK